MDKRPDCGYCGTKESAIMILGNKCVCGACIVALDKKQKEMQAKMMEEIIQNG